jgi:hypothetical protein
MLDDKQIETLIKLEEHDNRLKSVPELAGQHDMDIDELANDFAEKLNKAVKDYREGQLDTEKQ